MAGTAPRARGAPGTGAAQERLLGNSPAGAGSTHHGGPHRAGRREQPRGRGEHIGVPGRAASTTGTAPRARGALAAVKIGTSGVGEQPCGRGEHPIFTADRSTSSGTAPRARGALRWDGQIGGSGGNSPAGAGSTSRRSARPRSRWEQPRGRGEHQSVGFLRTILMGTAPRARGAPGPDHGRERPAGNSPAGAGSTRSTVTSVLDSGEQPRGRGEHRARMQGLKVRKGTAPRARGAPNSPGG